ncbi:MAG: pyridoxamine 5'-phosphate oxidase family protein [Clostridiales bacterium]|jgi:uncharacterized pyridoxamine 5'-phosphate oxidase family protein|nr:pyridoxamine 5'-phosphate oxidase family protein [Clostridiales bacterium]
MQKVLKFLKDNEVFYLATADGDQPHLRPFGVAVEYGGKLCLCTGRNKNVFLQLQKNPKAEICATAKDGTFLRVSGVLKEVHDDDAKEKFFAAVSDLKDRYSGDARAAFTVIAFDNPDAVFSKPDGSAERYSL